MIGRFSSLFGLTVDVVSLSLSPIAHSALARPKAPSNLKEVWSPDDLPPSEPQSSQSENRGALPNEQHHVRSDPRPQRDVSPPKLDTFAEGLSHHSPQLAGNHLEPTSSGNQPNHANGTTGQISGSTPNEVDHQQEDVHHLEHASIPSLYESETLPAVSSPQDSLSLRPSTSVPGEVHNESITKSGNVHPPSSRRVWVHRYLYL